MAPSEFDFKRWKEKIDHVLSLERAVDENLQAELIHQVLTGAIRAYAVLPPLERTWTNGKKDMVDGLLLKVEKQGVDPVNWQYWYILSDGLYLCAGAWISIGGAGGRWPNWDTAKRYVQGYEWHGSRALDVLHSIEKTGRYEYERIVDGKQSWIKVNVEDEE